MSSPSDMRDIGTTRAVREIFSLRLCDTLPPDSRILKVFLAKTKRTVALEVLGETSPLGHRAFSFGDRSHLRSSLPNPKGSSRAKLPLSPTSRSRLPPDAG